jgi:hypothetical protein
VFRVIVERLTQKPQINSDFPRDAYPGLTPPTTKLRASPMCFHGGVQNMLEPKGPVYPERRDGGRIADQAEERTDLAGMHAGIDSGE